MAPGQELSPKSLRGSSAKRENELEAVLKQRLAAIEGAQFNRSVPESSARSYGGRLPLRKSASTIDCAATVDVAPGSTTKVASPVRTRFQAVFASQDELSTSSQCSSLSCAAEPLRSKIQELEECNSALQLQLHATKDERSQFLSDSVAETMSDAQLLHSCSPHEDDAFMEIAKTKTVVEALHCSLATLGKKHEELRVREEQALQELSEEKMRVQQAEAHAATCARNEELESVALRKSEDQNLALTKQLECLQRSRDDIWQAARVNEDVLEQKVEKLQHVLAEGTAQRQVEELERALASMQLAEAQEAHAFEQEREFAEKAEYNAVTRVLEAQEQAELVNEKYLEYVEETDCLRRDNDKIHLLTLSREEDMRRHIEELQSSLSAMQATQGDITTQEVVAAQADAHEDRPDRAEHDANAKLAHEEQQFAVLRDELLAMSEQAAFLQQERAVQHIEHATPTGAPCSQVDVSSSTLQASLQPAGLDGSVASCTTLSHCIRSPGGGETVIEDSEPLAEEAEELGRRMQIEELQARLSTLEAQQQEVIAREVASAEEEESAESPSGCHTPHPIDFEYDLQFELMNRLPPSKAKKLAQLVGNLEDEKQKLTQELQKLRAQPPQVTVRHTWITPRILPQVRMSQTPITRIRSMSPQVRIVQQRGSPSAMRSQGSSIGVHAHSPQPSRAQSPGPAISFPGPAPSPPGVSGARSWNPVLQTPRTLRKRPCASNVATSAQSPIGPSLSYSAMSLATASSASDLTTASQGARMRRDPQGRETPPSAGAFITAARTRARSPLAGTTVVCRPASNLRSPRGKPQQSTAPWMMQSQTASRPPTSMTSPRNCPTRNAGRTPRESREVTHL